MCRLEHLSRRQMERQERLLGVAINDDEIELACGPFDEDPPIDAGHQSNPRILRQFQVFPGQLDHRRVQFDSDDREFRQVAEEVQELPCVRSPGESEDQDAESAVHLRLVGEHGERVVVTPGEHALDRQDRLIGIVAFVQGEHLGSPQFLPPADLDVLVRAVHRGHELTMRSTRRRSADGGQHRRGGGGDSEDCAGNHELACSELPEQDQPRHGEQGRCQEQTPPCAETGEQQVGGGESAEDGTQCGGEVDPARRPTDVVEPPRAAAHEERRQSSEQEDRRHETDQRGNERPPLEEVVSSLERNGVWQQELGHDCRCERRRSDQRRCRDEHDPQRSQRRVTVGPAPPNSAPSAKPNRTSPMTLVQTNRAWPKYGARARIAANSTTRTPAPVKNAVLQSSQRELTSAGSFTANTEGSDHRPPPRAQVPTSTLTWATYTSPTLPFTWFQALSSIP